MELEVDKPALDVKAGVRTTEFWLAVATFVVGLTLVIVGKTEIQQLVGAGLLSLTSIGYSVSRGLVKKAAVILLCVSFMGCGTINEQYIQADQGTYDAIAPEYEAYVRSGVQIAPDGGVLLDNDLNSPNFGLPLLRDQEERELDLRTVRLWKQRLEEAHAAAAREKAEAQ